MEFLTLALIRLRRFCRLSHFTKHSKCSQNVEVYKKFKFTKMSKSTKSSKHDKKPIFEVNKICKSKTSKHSKMSKSTKSSKLLKCLNVTIKCRQFFNVLWTDVYSYQVSKESSHRFWKRIFLQVFTIYGHGSHTGYVTKLICIYFHSFQFI